MSSRRQSQNPTNSESSSRISHRAISAAKKSGNLDAVTKLFTGVTKTNFRKELVDVVFYHLQPQWMELPPLEYGTEQARVERAAALACTASFCASEGMTAIVGHSPKALHGQIAQRILSHLDELCAWLTFLSPARISHTATHLTQRKDPSKQCAAILYMMDLEFADGVLAPILRASNQVVDYSIAAWVARDQIHNRVYYTLEQDTRCPIIHLIYKFLNCEESREMIFDTLYSAANSKNMCAAVIEAAVARLTALRLLPREIVEERMEGKVSGPKIMFMYLQFNMTIVQQLCIHPDMRAAFMKLALLEEFLQVLRIWILERSDRDQGFAILAIALGLVIPLDPATGKQQFRKGFTRSSTIAARRAIQGGFTGLARGDALDPGAGQGEWAVLSQLFGVA